MDVGQMAQLSCIFEATARKPGNVHRQRDFVDLTYVDFLVSAAAIAPVVARAASQRVGIIILESIQATRQVVSTNTNLGMILLLAPLAAVPLGTSLADGLPRVLAGLDAIDARLAYRAIRLAQPGGLGQTAEQDVETEPTLPLGEIMALAAERDRIAWQYAHGFRDVFDLGVPALADFVAGGLGLENAIVGTHLRLLADIPDSLIARKCGLEAAKEASRLARDVLASGWPRSCKEIDEFDCWLRADGHRRNPGTTADLVAASLFAALRSGIITLPARW